MEDAQPAAAAVPTASSPPLETVDERCKRLEDALRRCQTATPPSMMNGAETRKRLREINLIAHYALVHRR